MSNQSYYSEYGNMLTLQNVLDNIPSSDIDLGEAGIKLDIQDNGTHLEVHHISYDHNTKTLTIKVV
jgi:hypothetical protein